MTHINTASFLVGLTGQTGAGKTTVSALLEAEGFAVINADTVARQVVEKGTSCLRAMQRVFGGSILLPDGQMDRKAVAALIFNDAAARERYQAIIYPYITRKIRQQAEQLSAAGHRMILLDAPTLFESGIDRDCRAVISVIAPRDVRRARIIERDSLTAEQAEQRMNAQHSEEFFRAHSDAVIENNASAEMLAAAVRQTAEQLRQLAESYFASISNNKEEPIMENKDAVKALKESLLMQKKGLLRVQLRRRLSR